MSMRGYVATALAAALALGSACAGQRSAAKDGAEETGGPKSKDANSVRLDESPGGEIVPLASLPAPVPGGAEAKKNALPNDRDGLLRIAREKSASGDAAEALSIVDTLVVMRPDDAEAIELRGRILGAKGETVDAAADFKRCCAIGRLSCCSGGNAR